MIQRIYVVIEAGNDEDHLLKMTPITGPVDIPSNKHWRDERAIASVLRKMATEIEKGTSFEGVSR